jgi:hypothetical protein
MRGIGYGHPDWRHGDNKGKLAVQREDIRLDTVDPRSPHEFHIQAVSQVTIDEAGREPEHGIGVLEQLILGRYAPYGFQDLDHEQWTDTPNGDSTNRGGDMYTPGHPLPVAQSLARGHPSP